MPIIEVIVGKEDDDIRLDRWFKRHYSDVSFTQIAKLIRKGNIRVDGKKADVSQRINAGMVLKFPEFTENVVSDEKPMINWRGKKLAEELKDNIIFQDDKIIAINKPYGLAVQGGSKVYVSLDDALEFIVNEGEEKPRLVHRLDRETSGVIIVAKSARIAHILTSMFQQKAIEKTYLALVNGVPSVKRGTINYALSKEAKGNFENMQKSEKGVTAITDYEVLDYALGHVSLLRMFPRTGRMHQLRAHTQIIGHPILGDHKYRIAGVGTHDVVDKLHLLAQKIQFELEGKEYKFSVPLPDFFKSTMRQFGIDLGSIK